MSRQITLSAAVALALLIVIGSYLSHKRAADRLDVSQGSNGSNSSNEHAVPGVVATTSVHSTATAEPTDASSSVAAQAPATSSATNWLQALLGENGEGSELSPEILEQWLASGRTNAADLLAARTAGGGVDYLRMALTNFPNDPRVLLAATVLDDGPDARQDVRYLEAWMPNATEPELISYFDRLKLFGEASALAWLKQRRGCGGWCRSMAVPFPRKRRLRAALHSAARDADRSFSRKAVSTAFRLDKLGLPRRES